MTEALLKKLYTDPQFSSASYAGVNALYKLAKEHDSSITKKDVEKFITGSRTYTLHKPHFSRFPRLKSVAQGLLDCVHADLADFNKIASKNDNYR